MPTIGYLKSDIFRLSYIVEGEGIPAIVVGSSRYYSRTFSRHLLEKLRIAFIDHRGFAAANSCRDLSKFRLEILVDDIELARKELGLGQIVLIGHSGHAFMALEYAKRYPENVSRLVLMCVGPDYSPASHAATERLWNDSVFPGRKAALAANLSRLPREIEAAPEKAFITYCLRMGPKSWYDYTYDATNLWEGVEVNMAMFDYVWGNVFRNIDITKDIDHLKAPVFLALGRYDYLVPPAYLWEGVRDRFPDLTVRIFEKSGHSPQLEEPEIFDRELLDWIFRDNATVSGPDE